MNERILELWTQGTFTVVPRTGDYSSVSAEQIEKFAELLIRECANIDFRFKVGMTNDQEFDTGRVILEHFGVEE